MAQPLSSYETNIRTVNDAVRDNQSQITANTANIATNTTNIATNTSQIATNTTAITTLNGKFPVAIVDGGTGGTTAAGAVASIIPALTEDTTPDPANDFVSTYDASATTGKKVRLNKLTTNGIGFVHVDRNGTNQTGATAGAYNKINFNHEVADVNSWFDSATNFRYTPLVAGRYLVVLNVGGTGATSDCNEAAVYKNGALFAEGSYSTANSASSSISSCSAIVAMNGSTDYIEGYCYNASTTILGLTYTTYMMIVKVAD